MRIEFGIGIGFDRKGTPIDSETAEVRIQQALRLVADAFGGAFLIRGDGGWVDNGHLIMEPGIVIVADTPNQSVSAARKLALVLATIFNQAAVHITILPDVWSTDVRNPQE